MMASTNGEVRLNDAPKAWFEYIPGHSNAQVVQEAMHGTFKQMGIVWDSASEAR